MFQIAGEALIDLVLDNNTKNFIPKTGGAPFNTAIALGRLGNQVNFACPISSDYFGDLILQELEHSHVTPVSPQRVQAPSPLAFVTLNDKGAANYHFYRENTAERQLNDAFITQATQKVHGVFHIGGTCLIDETDFIYWFQLLQNAKKQGAIISIDPNVRADFIADKTTYLANITKALQLADIIKTSDEDCYYLFPQTPLTEILDNAYANAQVFIITQGADPTLVRFNTATTNVPLTPLEKIVDSIGAGDCFIAGLLHGLMQQMGTTNAYQTYLATRTLADVVDAVEFANTVAAYNCQQQGCNPPFLHQL